MPRSTPGISIWTRNRLCRLLAAAWAGGHVDEVRTHCSATCFAQHGDQRIGLYVPAVGQLGAGDPAR